MGLVRGVAVLLLQLAYETILLAPDFLKLVVGQLAPLFPGLPLELFPLALDDVPVHVSLPSASDLRLQVRLPLHILLAAYLSLGVALVQHPEGFRCIWVVRSRSGCSIFPWGPPRVGGACPSCGPGPCQCRCGNDESDDRDDQDHYGNDQPIETV